MFSAIYVLVALLSILSNGIRGEEVLYENEFFTLKTNQIEGGLDLISKNGEENEVIGNLAKSSGDPLEFSEDKGRITIHYPDSNLTIHMVGDKYGAHMEVTWEAHQNKRLQECFNLGSHQWYGGPQQKHQYWPIQKLQLSNYSYISKEADNAAIMEPYWLSSSGLFIYVDKMVPLFVDQNSIKRNHVCFIAEVKPPYSCHREMNILKYSIGNLGNAKNSHMYVVRKFLGKPTGYPDELMIKHPIWSTWAEYKRPINESIVLEYAGRIVENNFTNSQLEVDDLWEVCYGSLTVDENKFPNLTNLVLDLKRMGFRTTIWIHPFINKGCEPWYSDALKKGYLVVNEDGNADTQWWNSETNMAAYVDFTNQEAAQWWAGRLEELQTRYLLDSFKFDAGESSWSPQVPVQRGHVYEHPSMITEDYVRTCAQFGPIVEVRAGQRTQDLPIFVRMIDKDSEWDFENGLPTLVTTLLQMNMNGYPIVLPDMIGGNGYNGAPGKELFIRWLQANTFMPSLQFSYVPWNYDDETIRISRKFTELHVQYTDYVIEAFKRAVESGEPVNPPIWWISPMDPIALGVWDEYLLGDKILVAPVMKEGAVSRSVYLPKGEWMAEGNPDKIIKGPTMIKDYPAPLDTLPYFIKK